MRGRAARRLPVPAPWTDRHASGASVSHTRVVSAVTLDAWVESYDAAYSLLTVGVTGGRFVEPGGPAETGTRHR